MKNSRQNIQEKVFNFFENPKGKWAIGFQVVIFVMIILSVVIAFLEFFHHEEVKPIEPQLLFINHVILFVFTIEYVARLVTVQHKLQWVRKPLNIIDFIAIAPNYIELLLHIFVDTTELRVLRIIRLLRFARMLRLLKLFKYSRLFKKVFRFQETILEAIFPVMMMFVGLKAFVWMLEYYHLWISNQDLGNLFAIIGFALGIILSQKIGVSYDKFLQVEEALIRLYSNIQSLATLLSGKGKSMTKEWVRNFLLLLENPKADNFAINTFNAKLFVNIQRVEKKPGESIVGLYTDICRDAAFCLSKKVRLTPKAYDTLLHQATMLYLALVAVFIPGLTGMISIVTATYILYGMYNLTQDLDSILGGEFTLINLDMSELKYLVRK